MQTMNLKDSWENDFKLWTIGRSYCHSRQFKVDETTLNFLRCIVVAETS